MKIIDRFGNRSSSTRCYVERHGRADVPLARTEYLSVEHEADIFVDGILAMSVSCSPDSLAELAAGRLLTAGTISGADDILSIEVDPTGRRIDVALTPCATHGSDFDPAALTGDAGFSSLPAGNARTAAGREGADGAFAAGHGSDGFTPVRPIPWSKSDIFRIAEGFFEGAPGYRRTCGLHSCHVALGGTVKLFREDLGRHNAFDKAMGAALIAGIDLTQATVFSSGRVPVDMAVKAIRAGIPILATKAVPTAQAVELAIACDLTLLCSVHPDAMAALNDPLGCSETLRAM